MSALTTIYWPPSQGHTEAIAPDQNVSAGHPFILNASVTGQPFGPYIFDRVMRQVAILSLGDTSGVQFTISGIGSPVDNQGNPTQVLGPVTEQIQGPTLVQPYVGSSNIYAQVTSVVPNGNIQNVSLGFGSIGITDYVFLDYNRAFSQTSVQIQVIQQQDNTVTIYQSLTKPQTPNQVFGNWINMSQPIPAFVVTNLSKLTANNFAALPSPVSLTWATINLANPAVPALSTDAFFFTVLQQGIR